MFLDRPPETVAPGASAHIVVGAWAQVSRVSGVERCTPVCRLPAHVVIVGASAVGHRGGCRNDRAVAVPGGVPHQVAVRGQTKHEVYLDARRYTFANAEALARRWQRADPDRIDAFDLLADVFRVQPRSLDGRLQRALAELERGAAVPEAARRASLSAGHLGHLLREQTGAPPSLWRLWMRMQGAGLAIGRGANATYAAHQAGFADAAHLTRTARATLGVTPSGLIRSTWTAIG